MINTAFTPAEIDAVVEGIDTQLFNLNRNRAAYKARVAKETSEVRRGWAQRDLDEYMASTQAEYDSLMAATDVLDQVYDEAGRWARYFLCATDGGHVHHLPCHTLRIGTRLAWMPALSGLDESGMIAAVGHVACTVCFPNAPVHPAWLKSLAAAEAAKKGDKAAKWQKGLDTRVKKVANIEKRLAKARAILETGDEYAKVSARYDIEWNERDLIWAKREVARWEAKR